MSNVFKVMSRMNECLTSVGSLVLAAVEEAETESFDAAVEYGSVDRLEEEIDTLLTTYGWQRHARESNSGTAVWHCPACSLSDTARVRHEVGTVAYTFTDTGISSTRFRHHEHLGEYLYEMGLIDMDAIEPPAP